MKKELLPQTKIGNPSIGVEMDRDEIGLYVASANVSASCAFKFDEWKKDRGKDVASAPWYPFGSEYDGNESDRINDHHLNLAEKRSAREAVK